MFYSKKLKKFKNVNHCFFSKKKGFSKGIYKSLNCGRGSKDNKKNINKNLIFVSNKMGIPKTKLILMNQTHSNKVAIIKKDNLNIKIKADAMITKIKGIALGVVTADCVPIILYDVKNQIIGCIHAGWKGAYSNIIKNTIEKMKKINSNNSIYASVGPCIGQKNYEVDLIFFRKFVTDKLLKHKVKVDQVYRDTFSQKSNFFSYRRSKKLGEKDYGRCISTICMNKLY